MNNKFMAAFLAVGLITDLRGQDFLSQPVDETAAAPQSPLLQKADAISYTATFAHKQSSSHATTPAEQEAQDNANPQIKAVIVDKVGDVRHDIQQWSSASPTEVWYADTVAFEEGTDALGKPNGIHGRIALADSKTLFPELAWVDKKTFVGTIQMGPKKTIDVYRLSLGEGGAIGFPPFSFNHEDVFAYIDDATRLPLALKTSRYVVTYSYRTAPAALSLPAQYLTVSKEFAEWRARAPKAP